MTDSTALIPEVFFNIQSDTIKVYALDEVFDFPLHETVKEEVNCILEQLKDGDGGYNHNLDLLNKVKKIQSTIQDFIESAEREIVFMRLEGLINQRSELTGNAG